ncbi:MAG: hypothetical protein KAT58_10640 [candidate division Zixibacteria bacterium]|nr:hypothetical protein [candidate division Zixibacteria bacterium]
MRLTVLVVSVAALVAFAGVSLYAESGRIYGKLYTVDDEVFEGWLRWDKNEAFWDDVLDGTCERERILDRKVKKSRRYKDKRKRSVNFFGFRFGKDSWSFSFGGGSACELQFGHMQTLYVEGSSEATVTLKSGEEVEFTSGADLGSSVREILLVDINEGEIYFDWDDIEKIEFSEEPRDPDDGRERLYGRLSTRRGGDFTGWIEWDVDEVFSDDKLDGDEERRRKRKFAFSRIKVIERRSSSSSIVTLTDGKEHVLRNSNDVNSENRGIYVKSSDFGRIKVEWSDFEKVEFLDVPKSDLPAYDDFDGGRPLQGTVTTEDGEEFSGRIVWDDDEEYSWEHLNGEFKRMEMDIPFSLISMIEKSSRRGSVVTLKNGDSYLLKGSNDVDDDNRGIFIILDNGDVEEVDWYDFQQLVLR